jgi:hypothetical protein
MGSQIGRRRRSVLQCRSRGGEYAIGAKFFTVLPVINCSLHINAKSYSLVAVGPKAFPFSNNSTTVVVGEY